MSVNAEQDAEWRDMMKILFSLLVGVMIAWDFMWFLHACTVEKHLDRIIKLLEEKQKRE